MGEAYWAIDLIDKIPFNIDETLKAEDVGRMWSRLWMLDVFKRLCPTACSLWTA